MTSGLFWCLRGVAGIMGGMQTVRQIMTKANTQINNVFKDRKKHAVIIFAEVVVVVLLVNMIITPHRSMAAFCEVYNRESATLNNFSSNEQKLAMYRQLEAVSPDAIRSDVTNVREAYEARDVGSSARYATIGQEQKVSDYEKSSCGYKE